MKPLRFIVGILCIIMLGFFIWSISMAPATMAHGYYVTAAKFFAQGLIPWKDFNLMDLPLGTALLGIPYSIMGILTTGKAALALMMAMHVLNAILIGILLRNNHVKRSYLWSSILLYLVMVYSACGLNVCLEPFAVFFLLMSLFGLYSPNRTKNVLGSIMVLCAVGCKIQVVAFVPALYLYTILPKTAKHWHWKRGNVFLFSVIILLALGFAGLTLYSGNTTWYQHLRLSLSANKPGISEILYNWAVLGARTSIFLLVPGLLLAKKLCKGTCKWVTTAFLSTGGIALLMIFGNEKSWAQLVLPFLILSYGTILQDCGHKYKWMNILLVISFLFPSFLAYREFQKLEMGKAKYQQEEILTYLSRLPKKNAPTAVIPYKCSEFNIGAQIFSERNMVVHNPLHTTYGFINWNEPVAELKEAEAAEAILLPIITYLVPNFTGIDPIPEWAEDLSSLVRTFPITGNFGYVMVQKSTDLEEMLKRYHDAENNAKIDHDPFYIEDEDEHDHEHEHHHDHDHNHEHHEHE